MLDGFTLGAYALDPTTEPLTGAREEEWYAAFAGISGASGLEVPFRDGFHPGGRERFAELLPEGWHVVVTMLPLTMARLRADAIYGLASVVPTGRRVALDDLRAVCDEVLELEALLGRPVVRAVQFPSAPRPAAEGHPDAGAFAESLAEASSWNWGAAALVVEHCDAWTDAHPVSKGFLPLADETQAVRAAAAASSNTGAPLGQSINWGRSAIEERSADAPPRQVAELRDAGTLMAVNFSGASATGGALGAPWDDAHNPLDSADPSSLLTPVRVEATIEAAGASWSTLAFAVVKVKDPSDSPDLLARLSPLRDLTALVSRWL
jgi:hypothetical protein